MSKAGARTLQPSDSAVRMKPRTFWCCVSETRGPICVPLASGAPTRILAAASARRSVSLASKSLCTMSRLVAEHTWPVQLKMPTMTQSTTASRYSSASSNTTKADLPPSSRAVGRSWATDASSIFRPASALPVKESLSSAGWSISVCPVLPPPGRASGGPPVMTFSAPGGRPAPAATSPRAQQVRDASGEGLRTTAQPAARAGATFITACMSG
mmetsp:Transcript_40702/g.122930  ORF Transcript_40702/g.122930 Transcript_40702/m.122930 type:complete len:213 (-) Transcript_40702:531-1169(-)